MAKPLTVKAIENAKACGKRSEIPDGDMPGLYLIIQTSGAKSWAYRYRFGNAPKKLTIGAFPQIPLSDARALARAAARTVAEGYDPGEKKRAKKEADAATFEDAARRFLRRHARPNCSETHFKGTAWIFGLKPDPSDEKGVALIPCPNKKSLIRKWGKRSPSSIKEREIVNFLDDIVDGGTPVLANRILSALSKFFVWAKGPEGGRIVDANPCIEIKKPAKEKEGERILSTAEIRALWRAADRMGHPQGSAYKMLLLTGQRKTIVGQCHASHVDRREGIWTIPANQQGAKGTGNTLPITDTMAAIFDQCATAPYLFSTTGGEKPLYLGDKLKRDLDKFMLEELRKEAAEEGDDPSTVHLRDFDNHDIRRTMRTELSGLPIPKGEIVNELIVGHRQTKIKRTYDKFAYLEEKRKGLELWAARLESIVNPPKGNVVEFKGRRAS